MSDPQYELAIFGSTPLAAVLAGRLATEHRKRVVLVSETPSPFRLPTGFDLSVAPITRPKSWALLKAGTAETLKLLHQIGARHAVPRVDPLFVAESMAGNAALSHMRMMAMGFGFAVESVPHAAGQIGVRLRDAVRLDRPALAPVLTKWLGRAGVVRLEARDANAVFSRDDSVRIEHLGQKIEAAHAILADDEAILTRLDAAVFGGSLTVQEFTVTLTAPARRLTAPLVLDLDRGLALIEEDGRHVLAFSAGEHGEAKGLIVDGMAVPLRRLAQRRLRTIASPDGAPLVGPLRNGKTTVLAGFGQSGVFFAPALARHLCGTSSAAESAYFAARQATTRNAVADYTAPPLEALV